MTEHHLVSAQLPRTEVRRLSSSEIGQDYEISISLPRSYADSQEVYPVLYLLDGDILFGMVKGIMETLQMGNEIPELILVGIGYGTDQLEAWSCLRRRDLSPVVQEDVGATGGAAPFLRFIVDTLIPLIDANYRTDLDVRALAGHSYGGLFTLYSLLNTDGVFSRFVASSPPLHWFPCLLLGYERRFRETHPDLAARLFMAVGMLEEQEWRSELDALARAFEEGNYAGLEIDLAKLEGHTHYSVVSEVFTKGLKWIWTEDSYGTAQPGTATVTTRR